LSFAVGKAIAIVPICFSCFYWFLLVFSQAASRYQLT